MKEPHYVPITQSIGVSALYTHPNDPNISLIPGTHTFIAPVVKPTPGTVVFAEENEDQPSIDAANFNSIGGTIISLLLITIVISLISCIGRADFNFPFLLFGYYVWCLNSKWHPLRVNEVTDAKSLRGIKVSDKYRETCSIRYADTSTIRNIQAFTYLLIGLTPFDILWVAFATAAWTCWFEPDHAKGSFHCFNPSTHETLLQTYYMRTSVLYLAILNIFLKIFIIVLSWIWVKQQRKAAMDSYYQIRRINS